MHLFLIRHGQSFVNLEDWTEGYIDAGLTPLGQRQAQNVSQWLTEHVQLDALYTSTMARTLETAAYIAQAVGIPAQTDDRLREFGNCYASGLAVPPEAMPIEYAEFWGSERPHAPICTDGESWMLFRVRVSSFLDTLLERHQPDQKVAVVCHGGVIDATYDYIFNVGPHRRVEIWTHNTGIVHWEYCPNSGREIWRLHGHDVVHHLADCNGEWMGSDMMLRSANRHKQTSPKE